MPKRSPAIERLAAAVAAVGGPSRAAALLKCSRQSVHGLLRRAKPRLAMALKIREVFGIPVEDWTP